MRIYFDNCSLQRLFDDQSQPRILEEADAVVSLLELCESKKLQLISSRVLEFEISMISDPERRKASLEILRIAVEVVETTTAIVQRSFEFGDNGIKQPDALHLASAKAGGADYFCTTDDRFLRDAKKRRDLTLRSVSPIELLEAIHDEYNG